MTATNEFKLETPVNYEEKTLALFCIDSSGSMEGPKMNALNHSLQNYLSEEIQKDEVLASRLEIGIITFDSEVEIKQAPALVEQFTFQPLTTKGSTALADGVNRAIDMVEERKQWYKSEGVSYKRPYIIVVTDGQPDGNQDIASLTNRIDADTKAGRYVMVPLASLSADKTMMQSLEGWLTKEVKMPVKDLDKTPFKSFFQWLSKSISISVNGGGDDDWINQMLNA
jgi:uncharacterized protein YegL